MQLKSLFPAVALMISAFTASAQSGIDMKPLIGMQEKAAVKLLKKWKVVIRKSGEYEGLWAGYDDGFQMKVEEGKVTTIWIEFTNRRTGVFPFQADKVVTPNVELSKVKAAYGEPSETGAGGAWVKWKRAECQLHCEVGNSRVVMTTLMLPDWSPGQ